MKLGEVIQAKESIDENPWAAYKVWTEMEWKLKGFFDPVEDVITMHQPVRILMKDGIPCDYFIPARNPFYNKHWYGNHRC